MKIAGTRNDGALFLDLGVSCHILKDHHISGPIDRTILDQMGPWTELPRDLDTRRAIERRTETAHYAPLAYFVLALPFPGAAPPFELDKDALGHGSYPRGEGGGGKKDTSSGERRGKPAPPSTFDEGNRDVEDEGFASSPDVVMTQPRERSTKTGGQHAPQTGKIRWAKTVRPAGVKEETDPRGHVPAVPKIEGDPPDGSREAYEKFANQKAAERRARAEDEFKKAQPAAGKFIPGEAYGLDPRAVASSERAARQEKIRRGVTDPDELRGYVEPRK